MFDQHDAPTDLRRHEIALALFSGIFLLTAMTIVAAVVISDELNRLYAISDRIEQKLDILADRRPAQAAPKT
ncbi:hypothetical protein COA17_11165 [Sphingomonas ginsenosidimutans]|uniref:Uncharacterized protein n=1 Tax=Sphingomonas ginsenosidimutans TaxID=862134 RepID=A0A2A4HYE5_9SPHN|nr:hypothetical protein [Sphingomonas ginsenosidimutans]PCG08708.1 hypothetical protein COA17_11165 [Sphingomonas ginsenosidimutans]